MNSSFKSWSKTLQASELTPIVCQILHESKVEVLDWRINPLSGGASVHTGLGLGVYKVTGSARCKGQDVMWTCALKVFGPSDIPEYNLPSHLNYWKRELLAYESGILDHLPGNIVAPRCYAVQELSDGVHCLWFEFIQESDKDWSMEEHYLAARHLGQFNGSYLMGHPVPVRTEWMLSGRTHLVADRQRPDVDRLMSYCKTDLGRWMSHDSVNRMDKLWEKRQALIAHLNRLPNCFCHHDAQRRNLMLTKAESSTTKVTAIDWAFVGIGKIGEEIGTTLSVDLLFMDVASRDARVLSQAIFTGYCDGLRDAGWHGDLNLARFGYVVTAALSYGLAFCDGVAHALQQPNGDVIGEAIVGKPIHEVVEQYIETLPFLLDCGDEAITLMQSI